MTSRRKFIQQSFAASAAIPFGLSAFSQTNKENESTNKQDMEKQIPVVISTWQHGVQANDAAWKVLANNGRALQAVEQGVRISESDPEVDSVGYGGLPDRDGNLTLDACIMDEFGNCGAVACLEHIKNPISVARLVMERTPHVMLAGKGALDFALQNGFLKENLLTEKSKIKWEEWKVENNYHPMKIDKYNHDTISMLAIDKKGNMSGACTTSGLAWKLPGRVGDSPIIGAGMYTDNEIGAACATGQGEAVMKMCGSFLIVELMRQGKSPQEACEVAINRMIKSQKGCKEFQVGFLALNKNGIYGAYSLQEGFQYAVYVKGENRLFDSDYIFKK